MTQQLNRHHTNTFNEIRKPEDLDFLLDASHQHPVVIFKHSPVCGTSAQAYDELDELLAADLGTDVQIVNVLTSRPLSQAIAQRFGIRHESPQVLVLRDGTVQWHASHFSVTVSRLRDAVQRHR